MKYSQKLAFRSKRVYLKEMNNYLNGKKVNGYKLSISALYMEKFFPELFADVQEKVSKKIDEQFKKFINNLEDIRP